MSQENVETVRRVYDAVARGDSEAVLALYDEDVEIDGSRLPEARLEGPGILRGHAGLRRFSRDWGEAWESAQDACEELIDLGDRVVSVVARRGRGRTSGIQLDTERAGVWTVRDGKVVHTVWFPSKAEALEAARRAEDVDARWTAARAMAEENLEAVRAVYDQWAEGDFRAGLDLYDADVLLVSSRDLPDPDRYVGVESMRAYMREYLEPLDNVTWTAEAFIPAGNSVVVATRQGGRGTESGLSVEARLFMVWTFRGRKVIRLDFYLDRTEALDAVGLSE